MHYKLPCAPHLITRDDGGWFNKANIVKDLALLGRDMSSVLLVDDRHDFARASSGNSVIVPPFGGEGAYQILCTLTSLMRQMVCFQVLARLLFWTAPTHHLSSQQMVNIALMLHLWSFRNPVLVLCVL